MKRRRLADELDVTLDRAEEQLRLVRCFIALERYDAAIGELRCLAVATVRDLVALIVGVRSERNIERHAAARKDALRRAG